MSFRIISTPEAIVWGYVTNQFGNTILISEYVGVVSYAACDKRCDTLPFAETLFLWRSLAVMTISKERAVSIRMQAKSKVIPDTVSS